ncbi:MAG: BrnA antitoxin family protein [Sulfuricella sp.]|nr:BrnA antitoxin family protein [Sulfuricella sp.]
MRFDADVLAALKTSGKGWQTRVNEMVREWLKGHSAA